MRSLVAGLALASLTVLAASGCAAPEESEDVGDAAGAAVGTMPERTTLFGAGGLVAYFDGGWEKPSVTLFRGNAKQTLRCEAQPFRLELGGGGYSNLATTALRCFDTPASSTAAEYCQVIFNRRNVIGIYGGAEVTDGMEASCWNGDRTTAKQKAFLKFVLGETQTTTVPNKERTEPTAEQTYAMGVALSVKNTGKDVDADPYAFSWTLLNAVSEVAKGRLTKVDVSSPGATVSMSGLDREYKPVAGAKSVTLVEGGKVVAYPEMVKRIRAGFGLK